MISKLTLNLLYTCVVLTSLDLIFCLRYFVWSFKVEEVFRNHSTSALFIRLNIVVSLKSILSYLLEWTESLSSFHTSIFYIRLKIMIFTHSIRHSWSLHLHVICFDIVWLLIEIMPSDITYITIFLHFYKNLNFLISLPATLSLVKSLFILFD